MNELRHLGWKAFFSQCYESGMIYRHAYQHQIIYYICKTISSISAGIWHAKALSVKIARSSPKLVPKLDWDHGHFKFLNTEKDIYTMYQVQSFELILFW